MWLTIIILYISPSDTVFNFLDFFSIFQKSLKKTILYRRKFKYHFNISIIPHIQGNSPSMHNLFFILIIFIYSKSGLWNFLRTLFIKFSFQGVC